MLLKLDEFNPENRIILKNDGETGRRGDWEKRRMGEWEN
jgi:hypothetical protein